MRSQRKKIKILHHGVGRGYSNLLIEKSERGQRSAVSGQRSAVSGQRSAVSGQRSAVSGQRSAVSGQRSAVSGQRSGREISELVIGNWVTG